MRPPLRLGEFTLPKHEFITLPPTQLLGVTQSYTCKLEEISDFRNQMRVQFWRDFLGNSPSIPPVLYGLHEPRPSLEKDDEQEVFYTTALTPEMANGHLQHAHPVTLEGGEYVKEAKIGRAVMDADVFISLTHFKGHESTGFGGAIKNIGMGCGSRAGKMQQHASGKPAVREKLCRGCRRCAKECGSDAITYVNKKAVIDYDKCKGCGRCIGACSFDAIYNPNYNANELLDRKMAEYAQAVCYDRPCFHISLVQDISPNCDCHGENDAPILPDIGMFASFDPVALDQACADACLKAAPIANSQLGEHLSQPGWHCHHDHFKDSNPNIEWQATLDQAEKIGLGTRQYELKRI